MRERVIDAADRVLREKGLARTTTKEIAEKARCSEGTLYRYFKSKEELFIVVLAERMPEFLPTLRALHERVGKRSISTNLETVAVAAVSFYSESIPMATSVFAEPSLLALHRDWMRDSNTGPHRAVELLAQYLSAEQELGRLDPDADTRAAAGLLLGSCYLRALQGHFSPVTPVSDRRFARAAVRTLLVGLAEDGPPDG